MMGMISQKMVVMNANFNAKINVLIVKKVYVWHVIQKVGKLLIIFVIQNVEMDMW